MNCLPSWSNSIHSDIQRRVVLFFFSVENVRHTSGYFFYRKLYNGGNYSTIWQNKTNFYTILTTNLYDKSQTKVPDLYDNIYIDNIQKAVVICLICRNDNISFWCWIQRDVREMYYFCCPIICLYVFSSCCYFLYYLRV